MNGQRVENDMFDTMWAFLEMGSQKANYPALKQACMELRKMMMQKTAGQRKDRKKDISFDNLPRIKNEIIIEAMALVLSGEFDERNQGCDADNILKKGAAGSTGDGQSQGACGRTGTGYGGDEKIGMDGK